MQASPQVKSYLFVRIVSGGALEGAQHPRMELGDVVPVGRLQEEYVLTSSAAAAGDALREEGDVGIDAGHGDPLAFQHRQPDLDQVVGEEEGGEHPKYRGYHEPHFVWLYSFSMQHAASY